MRNFRIAAIGCMSLGLAAPLAFAQQSPGTARPTMPPANQLQPAAGGAGVVSTVRLPALPAGFASKTLNESKDIHHTIATATQAALTKAGFDDLVERLNDQDRNRIGKDGFAEKEFADLDGRVAQLQTAFKDRYGEEFAISDETKVFGQYALLEGEVNDPGLILNHWPVAATAPQARTAGDSLQPSNNTTPKSAEAVEDLADKANLDKGRNIAVLGLPRVGAFSELHASLIHELPDSWTLDIPNHITGQQLHDNLLTNLAYLGEHAQSWPANADDARRVFASAVISSLYGVKPMTAAQMDAKGDVGDTSLENQQMNRQINERMNQINRTTNQPEQNPAGQ